jgi:spermidine synthase
MSTSAKMGEPRASLMPLFLVSAGAVGFESALTRYFAVAKWSEYGYWVISIVMVGFALSGVAMALLRDPLARIGPTLRAILPALMTAAAAGGYYLTTQNPFNPLELQNPATWAPQLTNIALYYAYLLPFYFLTGLYISLTFVLNAREIGRAYGYDLLGAGAGAALALALMFLVRPYDLVPLLILLLALAAVFQAGDRRWLGMILALVALSGGEALLTFGKPPVVNQFKAVYAPSQTPGAQVLDEVKSPRGYYQLLDDFTERVDTDVSNNAGLMGLAGPPKTFGLYRDGNRIAAIARPGDLDARYAPAAMSAAPYLMKPNARVLLIGASGGYRAAEALSLGAAHLDVVEPEPVIRRAMTEGLDRASRLAPDERVSILDIGPVAAVRAGRYDIIDIAPDFMDAGPANETAFAAEAIAADLGALKADGVVSIPISIRDFPVYALRMLATAREGLKQAGVADPAAHVVVYRSAWSVRILLSKSPWSPEALAALKTFCDQRSFDMSYYPGIDVPSLRGGLYNDLPQVSFASGEIVSQGPDDAIADEAAAVLRGEAVPSGYDFNLSPVTLDRPAFHSVLKLDHVDTLIRRIEILPQAEIGALVNLAVLAQAILIALVVLAVPLLAPRKVRPKDGGSRLWPVVYFPALGLGFLFIEIFLIEKASFLLNDRTSAFALVLTGMLIFSGLGSMIAGMLTRWPKLATVLAALLVAAWCVGAWQLGQGLLMDSLDLPFATRALLVLLAAAPPSLALGLPFPMGLSRIGDGPALPWAWGLNGAFSVVATPLANLIAREAGFSWLLIGAAGLYLIAALALPAAKRAARAQTEDPVERMAA